MKKEIKTQIKINAPVETVWRVLTDFEKYPEWNPFVKSLTGNVGVGKKIKVKLPGMNFTPLVLVFDKNREFKWRGKLLVDGVFDGEHRFVLSKNEDGSTNFEHAERFSGILVRAFSRKLENEIKPGFEEMNLQLKKRAEQS